MNTRWANSTLLLLAALVLAPGRLTRADDQVTTQYRVLVDTDLGGDPDDIQSLYRLIHYSDILKAEGIVSSPGPGSTPRADLIRDWIRRVDVGRLRANGHGSLMTEAELLGLVKDGSREPGSPRAGADSDGSKLIIARAHANSGAEGKPLWVLVWGSMTTLAQALHDDPSIAPKIRVYSIGSSNTVADPASRDYVFRFMQDKLPDFWWIENGILPRRSTDTFRGVYQGGDQTGEWGNEEFIRQNIRGHGSTHNGLFDRKCGDAFPVAEFAPWNFEGGRFSLDAVSTFARIGPRRKCGRSDSGKLGRPVPALRSRKVHPTTTSTDFRTRPIARTRSPNGGSNFWAIGSNDGTGTTIESAVRSGRISLAGFVISTVCRL